MLKNLLAGFRRARHVRRPHFAHVVNPLIAERHSDLVRAQPITFETMRMAREFAGSQGIYVDPLAVFFPEHRSIVPPWFRRCEPLGRSCLDFAPFEKPRKLPLFQDILDRALAATAADYLIYTNIDIALMPHFYVTVQHLLNDNPDALYIFRRTLSEDYQSPEQIPLMFSDMGEDHPGTDCFVMKRELVEKIDMLRAVIGAEFSAYALDINLRTLAKSTHWHRRLHLTFHIGDRRPWRSQHEYSLYNLREADKIIERISNSSHVVHRDMIAFFQADFVQKKNRIVGKPSPQ